MSKEALKIAEKRREVKGKGEKERYSHLNADFQRIARHNKKVFLSGQCKEIDENIIIGKTRDLFKKIRDTKGTFHAKMGTIKTWYVPNRSKMCELVIHILLKCCANTRQNKSQRN